jgi:hypothetical protein
VKPLRCAVHASRKPGVSIHVHPFDACVSPLAAADKTPVLYAPENKHRSTFWCGPRRLMLVIAHSLLHKEWVPEGP